MANLADLMKPRLGSSPDQLKDYADAYGGTLPLEAAVLAARYGEAGANPKLTALSPEDRAALDRYANFAEMAKASTNPVSDAVDYLGGMGTMAATEAMKAAAPLQRAASTAWNVIQGTPNAAPFFGGVDTSAPSLANLLAAHYGWVEGKRKK